MSYERIRRSFKIEGNKYTYIPAHKFNIDKLKLSSTKYKDKILNIGVAFDIETTSYYSQKYDKELATMYIWQLGINKDTIIGRTWDEFVEVIDKLSEWAHYHDGIILCLVQNLSFEFQFIKGLLSWNKNKDGYPDIFAKDDRTILYARYKNIEFRDTLALTAMPLSRYKKNYNLDVAKLSGDLDYSLLRHSDTPVSNQEVAYCINDVQVLTDFFYKYLVEYYLKVDKRIPLTSTGIVRAEIKEEFNKMSKEDKKRWRNRIQNAQPDETVYKFWRQYLFRGGYVHANTIACNYLWEEYFDSYDLKSAHPAQMLQHKFSYKYYRRKVDKWSEVYEQSKTGDYGFFIIAIFKNIECSGWHSLESKNKIITASPDAIYDNGRLVKASMIKVALTQIDYENYLDLYVWESMEVRVLFQSKMDYLPEYVRKTVLHYFSLKESLPKDSVEYMLAKRKLNACFGMAATSLPEMELVYDEEAQEMTNSHIKKSYDELIRYLIMLPQWAIEIAAYTRRDIVKSVKACGFHSLYYDTDSNKISSPEKFRDFFEAFNNEKIKLNESIETFGYDPKLIRRIGCFEKEYTGTRFKVLGAKRYIVEHDNEIHVTVAGMVKGSLEEYCKKNDLNIWDEFNDGLCIPAGDSKKKTTVYYDSPFEDTLVDYKQVKRVVKERSCVAIIDIPFSMSMEVEFINRINALAKERERMVYNGYV